PVSFTFQMDTTAPAVTLTSPANGQSFTTNPAISGTVTDANGVANLNAAVDGGAAQPVTFDSQGQFSFTPAATSDGAHSVTFTAHDSAGNQSSQVQLNYFLDTTAPAVTVSSPSNGQSIG